MTRYVIQDDNVSVGETGRSDNLQQAKLFSTVCKARDYADKHSLQAWRIIPVNVKQTITLENRSLMYEDLYVHAWCKSYLTLTKDPDQAMKADEVPNTPWEMYLG